MQKYYVSNIVLIKTAELEDIGKIIMRTYELKMSVSNDITYAILNEQKQKQKVKQNCFKN